MGNNAYAYCLNAPVSFEDPCGSYVVPDDPLRGPVWGHLGGNATGVSSANVGGGGGGIPIPVPNVTLQDIGKVMELVDNLTTLGNGFGNLSRASEFGIKGYSALRADLAGTGLEAHHNIEVRFLKGMGIDTKNAPSVALTKEEHRKFTNHWRQLYPYGKTVYSEITPDELWEKAQIVYHGYPELLDAAWDTLF